MNWEELIESETKKDYFKAIKKAILSDNQNGKSIITIDNQQQLV